RGRIHAEREETQSDKRKAGDAHPVLRRGSSKHTSAADARDEDRRASPHFFAPFAYGCAARYSAGVSERAREPLGVSTIEGVLAGMTPSSVSLRAVNSSLPAFHANE